MATPTGFATALLHAVMLARLFKNRLPSASVAPRFASRPRRCSAGCLPPLTLELGRVTVKGHL